MSSEKPLCEDVNVKSKLQCGAQDGGGARTVGHHRREAASMEWSQPKTEALCAVSGRAGAGITKAL